MSAIVLSGWGRATRSSARLMQVTDEEAVEAAVAEAGHRGVLARGSGRAYGDAATNAGGCVLDLGSLDDVRIDGTRVTAGAGVRLDALMERLSAVGLFPPVVPGTRHVTLAGLIAADVHGKNHHTAGSWGSHVTSLRLVDGHGQARTLSPDDPDPSSFWATVGGMGLTGVITEVTFQAMSVPSTRIRATESRYATLADVMDALRDADRRATYSVAWIDSCGGGSRLGRGIVSVGEHDSSASPDPLSSTRSRLRVPVVPPVSALVPATIGAFNEAWYRRAGQAATAKSVSAWSFFFPLDQVVDWNRLYGPRGFVQYQFVVPDEAAHVVGAVLEQLRDAGASSFLSVLKRFGPGNQGPLSFPRPGWTLALDLAAANPRLPDVLDRLDDEVTSVGGRHYLAKDSRMSIKTLRAGYPRLCEWQEARDRLDPNGIFQSDLGRRLDLASRR